MTTQPHLPLLVRITGDLDRDAAGDLAATLRVAGWEGASVMRPKHGAAEVLVALTGFSASLTALLRVLPPVLEQWSGRNRLREFEVIVERDGAEEVRIAIAGRSDRDTMEELLSGIRGVAAGPGDGA